MAALGLIGLTALVSVEDTLQAQGRRDDPHPGRRGRRRELRHPGREAHRGAVITTASAANHDYLKKLGADQIIDYTSRTSRKVVSGVDAVFDTVGGDVAKRAFDVLEPGGRAAFIGSGPTAPVATRNDVASLRPKVGRDRAHLERIVELVTRAR